MAAAPLQLLSAFATVCIGSLQMGWYLLLTGFLFTFDWSVPKLVGLSLAFPSRAMRRCGYWTALVYVLRVAIALPSTTPAQGHGGRGQAPVVAVLLCMVLLYAPTRPMDGMRGHAAQAVLQTAHSIMTGDVLPADARHGIAFRANQCGWPVLQQRGLGSVECLGVHDHRLGSGAHRAKGRGEKGSIDC